MGAGLNFAAAITAVCLGVAFPLPTLAGTEVAPTGGTRPGSQSESIAESEAFELAKEVGTPAAWEAFLKRYPNGFYADLARAALAKPQAAPTEPRPVPAAVPREEPSSSGPSLWTHNGSLMRLEAEGAERRFYYERPRSGMAQQGVSRGTLLFDGRKSGDGYEGTAFIFSRRCGKFAYRVSGHVENGQRRVVMFGRAPKPGSDCRIVSHRDDTLVFDYQGR